MFKHNPTYVSTGPGVRRTSCVQPIRTKYEITPRQSLPLPVNKSSNLSRLFSSRLFPLCRTPGPHTGWTDDTQRTTGGVPGSSHSLSGEVRERGRTQRSRTHRGPLLGGPVWDRPRPTVSPSATPGPVAEVGPVRSRRSPTLLAPVDTQNFYCRHYPGENPDRTFNQCKHLGQCLTRDHYSRKYQE